MEEYIRNHWDVWHAFILGWGDPRCRKPRVPPREVLTPLHAKCTQSLQGANTDLQFYNRASLYAPGPHPRPREHCQATVAQTSGWGSLTDYNFPTKGDFEKTLLGKLFLRENLNRALLAIGRYTRSTIATWLPAWRWSAHTDLSHTLSQMESQEHGDRAIELNQS